MLEQVATRGPWSMPLRIRALVDAHRGRVERARTTLVPLVDEAERTNDLYWTVPSLSSLASCELTAGDHRAVDRRADAHGREPRRLRREGRHLATAANPTTSRPS